MGFELTGNEGDFLAVYREFRFLCEMGYKGSSFAINGPEVGCSLVHEDARRRVSVSLPGYVHVVIYGVVNRRFILFRIPRSVGFSLEQIYSEFESEDPVPSRLEGGTTTPIAAAAKQNAEFMRQHLLPVLDGTMWIDELLDQRG